MAWNVKTLDAEAFAAACHELQVLIASSGFRPDAIVGIRTGGFYVAENMFESIPHYYTEFQRPSTKLKHGGLKRILKLLPRSVKDGLRILESHALARNSNKALKDVKIEVCPAIPDEARNILIVDDAVDSGATLSIVQQSIAKSNPDATIASAVITVTTSSPAIHPEYFLYNRVLVRFPWSLDA